jgi:excisionase family DNA binding protein
VTRTQFEPHVTEKNRLILAEQAVRSNSLVDHSYPEWLTVAQLCRRWQLDRKTIYKFIDAEILPVWRVSRHLYRIALRDVLRFEARNRSHLAPR